MKIQIISDGCKHCQKSAQIVEQVALSIDPTIKITHLQDIANMIKMGVAQVPAVIIDGKIASSGKHLTEQEARELIEKYR